MPWRSGDTRVTEINNGIIMTQSEMWSDAETGYSPPAMQYKIRQTFTRWPSWRPQCARSPVCSCYGQRLVVDSLPTCCSCGVRVNDAIGGISE